MVNENIEKLKKKNKENPSKFFVPLAEEYKKAGMVDEAISVLLTGLKNQPYYIGAMVALGKLYLQKDMLLEAQEEFEKAVGLAPDNILAHKKLADIYYERGETEKALKEYQSVVRLNPGDEEAKVIKLSLEKRIQETQAHEEKVADLPAGRQGSTLRDEAVISSNPGEFQDTLVAEQPVSASQGGEDIRTVKIKDIPVYEIDEEINGAELGIKIPEKLKPVEERYVTRELEEFRKIVERHSEKQQVEEAPEAPEAQNKEAANIQDLLIQ
ncbi:MAG: tetratricopeptide repeat protein, partial [Nitrospirota bacterium]